MFRNPYTQSIKAVFIHDPAFSSSLRNLTMLNLEHYRDEAETRMLDAIATNRPFIAHANAAMLFKALREIERRAIWARLQNTASMLRAA